MDNLLERGDMSHDIMTRLPVLLKLLGSPFCFSDLIVFEAILDEYIRSGQTQCISEFCCLENVVKLRYEKRTGTYSLDEFDRMFAMLTGALPNPSVIYIYSAKERYRHAVTIITMLSHSLYQHID